MISFQDWSLSFINLTKTLMDNDPEGLDHSNQKKMVDFESNIYLHLGKFDRLYNDLEEEKCKKIYQLFDDKCSRILLKAIFILFIGTVFISYIFLVSRHSNLQGNFPKLNIGNVTGSFVIGKFFCNIFLLVPNETQFTISELKDTPDSTIVSNSTNNCMQCKFYGFFTRRHSLPRDSQVC